MQNTHTLSVIGNPNCGKTTLFNLLTGAKQKVGNWSGVTVEKKTGTTYLLNKQKIELTDLVSSIEGIKKSRINVSNKDKPQELSHEEKKEIGEKIKAELSKQKDEVVDE